MYVLYVISFFHQAQQYLVTYPEHESSFSLNHPSSTCDKSGCFFLLAKKPSFNYFGPFPLFKKSTGKLPCKPDAAPAPNQYVWYYKGSELKTNTSGGRYILSGDGTLLIDNVVKSDEGNYKCKATNIIGADTSPEGFSTVYGESSTCNY